jgi:hypothetical protein
MAISIGPVQQGSITGVSSTPINSPQFAPAPSVAPPAAAPTAAPINVGPSTAQINAGKARSAAAIAQGGFQNEARNAGQNAAFEYGNKARDLATGIRTGQNAVNEGMATNALNLRRGMADVAEGVRTGLRNGGIMVASMNAGNSSATEAIARAMARRGNNQAADINNQSALELQGLQGDQAEINRQESEGMQSLRAWRDLQTRTISDNLWKNLQDLDFRTAEQGAGGAVDMGARDRIIAEAQAALNEIDNTTNAALGAVNPYGQDQIQQRATEMEAAGIPTTNPFAVEAVPTFGNPQAVGGPAIGRFGTAPRIRGRDERF